MIFLLLLFYDQAKATITIVRTLSTTFGIINDVVVNSDYRGNRLGRRLTEALIEVAKTERATKIILSSNPDNPEREAARALYTTLGFESQTNGRWMVLKLNT